MSRIIFVCLLLPLCFACNSSLKITEKGLSYAKLGKQMPVKGIARLAGVPARDTLYDEGGFVWRALILSYGDGEVFLEEDFGRQGLINRIRVESAKLKVGKQRFVGMTWADLQPMRNNWDAMYLTDYQMWDVISNSQGRIHYLIKEEREAGTFDIEQGLKSIEEHAKVSAIVVM